MSTAAETLPSAYIFLFSCYFAVFGTPYQPKALIFDDLARTLNNQLSFWCIYEQKLANLQPSTLHYCC